MPNDTRPEDKSVSVQFRCAIEEPLVANSRLRAVIDSSGELGFAAFGVPNLSRYSFGPSSDRDDPSLLARSIMDGVVRPLELDANWLVSWRHVNDGDLRIRCLTQLSKLRKAGWSAASSDNVGAATIPISESDEIEVPPPLVDDRMTGWSILLGPRPSADEMIREPFAGTIRMFARTCRMEPGERFLTALSERNGGLIYPVRDHLGRIGLVLVSPIPVQSQIRGLDDQGLLSTVEIGNAESVWK